MSPSKKKKVPPFRYIFGPVYSWRLGVSLGIDPLAASAKACPFDCIYCQLGKTRRRTRRRRIFVPTEAVIREIKTIPPRAMDYITFSGYGEPTLAENLGAMIRAVRKVRREKIAVITNAALIDRRDVRADLALADCVLVKLDAWDPGVFQKINRPHGVVFSRVVRGIKKFRKEFKGRLALQIMLMDKNKDGASRLAALAADLGPDEIQINTPLRKSPVRPLSRPVMHKLRKLFRGFRVRMVYQSARRRIRPLDARSTEKRHGRTR